MRWRGSEGSTVGGTLRTTSSSRCPLTVIRVQVSSGVEDLFGKVWIPKTTFSRQTSEPEEGLLREERQEKNRVYPLIQSILYSSPQHELPEDSRTVGSSQSQIVLVVVRTKI